jgi:CheY-like chemotaxis protein
MSSDLILIVDDDPGFQEALRDALEDEDFAVDSAADGAEALGMLRAGCRPKVILLDYMMSNVNGPMFVAAVRSEPEFRYIPIVLLTADGRAQNKASQLGLRRFPGKPVKIEDLLDAP